MRAIFMAHARMVERHPALAKIVFSDQLRLEFPSLQQRFSAIHAAYHERIADLIDQAVNDGLTTASPSAGATLFLSMIQGLSFQFAIALRPMKMQDEAKAIYALFERAIGAGSNDAGRRGTGLLPEPPLRYHAALVTLHWISALLIMAALASGFLVLDTMPNSAPQKVPLLFWHTILEGVDPVSADCPLHRAGAYAQARSGQTKPLAQPDCDADALHALRSYRPDGAERSCDRRDGGTSGDFRRTGFRTAAGVFRSNADLDRPFPVCKDHRRVSSPYTCLQPYIM